MVENDKLWHFLASTLLVWFFFGLISWWCYCCQCIDEHETTENNDNGDNNSVVAEFTRSRSPNEAQQATSASWTCCTSSLSSIIKSLVVTVPRRICMASLFAFLVGAVKEIGDVLWNGWPWCNDGVCNGDGWDIVANMVGIAIGALCLWLWYKKITISKLCFGNIAVVRPRH